MFGPSELLAALLRGVGTALAQLAQATENTTLLLTIELYRLQREILHVQMEMLQAILHLYFPMVEASAMLLNDVFMVTGSAMNLVSLMMTYWTVVGIEALLQLVSVSAVAAWEYISGIEVPGGPADWLVLLVGIAAIYLINTFPQVEGWYSYIVGLVSAFWFGTRDS